MRRNPDCVRGTVLFDTQNPGLCQRESTRICIFCCITKVLFLKPLFFFFRLRNIYPFYLENRPPDTPQPGLFPIIFMISLSLLPGYKAFIQS